MGPGATTTCPSGVVNFNQTTDFQNGGSYPLGSSTVEFEITDECGNFQTCAFVILVQAIGDPQDYCESESDFPWHEWISNVSFAGINNPSGKTSYSDFTNQSGNVTTGNSYTIDLTTTYSWQTYDEYFQVWIDYNQDGIFQEPSELAGSFVANAASNSVGAMSTTSGTIAIPTTALDGATRMRIAMKRGQVASSCGAISFGEIEDYTLVISNNNTLQLLSL